MNQTFFGEVSTQWNWPQRWRKKHSSYALMAAAYLLVQSSIPLQILALEFTRTKQQPTNKSWTCAYERNYLLGQPNGLRRNCIQLRTEVHFCCEHQHGYDVRHTGMVRSKPANHPAPPVSNSMHNVDTRLSPTPQNLAPTNSLHSRNTIFFTTIVNFAQSFILAG